MYEAFYGLEEKPFNLTPDPRFLYLSEKHKEAFAHLLYGIKNRCGFVMVSGEIGTGKTTICRTLVSQLDPDTEIAFIFNPYLEPDELLRKINEDFGIASRATTVKGLIDELNGYLLNRRAEGKNCVLVIDEAQNLKPAVLEQVRLLSNLETESEKLLQIVLIGQPELAQMLQLPELRQLNQRITARYHLKSLDLQETLHYIAFRIKTAGGHGRVYFSRAAIRAIYRYSGGTPRVINALCDRALLIGYTRESQHISKAVIQQAVREVRGPRFKAPKPAAWRRLIPSGHVVMTAVLIVILVQVLMATTAQPPAAPSNAGPASQPLTLTPLGEVSRALASTEPAPRAEAAAPEAPAPALPDTFGSVLDRLDPPAACNAAAVSLLRAWNMALVGSYPAGDTAEGLVEFAQMNGLAAEPLEIALEQCKAIDLPAFIRVAGERSSLWLGLVGWGPEGPRVTTGMGQTRTVAPDELKTRYLGQAVILWRDPAPGQPVLTSATSGEAVRQLQAQLVELDRLEGVPTGVYDNATLDAIAQIQRETGLYADGKAGRQTRMVLSSWLAVPVSPSLVPPASEGAETSIAQGHGVAAAQGPGA